MHLEATLTQLRQLRLSVMANSLEQRLKNGDANGLSPEDFFALLVEDEYSSRQSRKLERMIAHANFKPEQACLENISYNPARSFQKKDLIQFTTATWIEQAHNIIITGSTGTGKTYIAEAIGLAACKLGFSARKIRYKSLFEEIASARGTGTFLKYLKKIQSTRVLIIDDFLMGQASPDDIACVLEIVEERSQLGPLILTTQFPVAQWHKLMPDPTIADAICDRLVHTAIIFNLKGDSMRKSKEKSQSK
jgi:DNA replication protein DnaC